MGMRVDIVTLFPEMCQQVLDSSIIGRAAKKGYIETHCHQIRDYTLNRQKQMPAACGCIGIFDHPYAYPSLACTQDGLQKKALPTSQAECPPSAFLTS